MSTIIFLVIISIAILNFSFWCDNEEKESIERAKEKTSKEPFSRV